MRYAPVTTTGHRLRAAGRAPREALRRLASGVRCLGSAVAVFRAQHGPLMAAAVSFWALLSIVPMILLGVSVFGYLVGSSDDAFQRVMSYADAVLSGNIDAFRDVLRDIVRSRGSVGGSGLVILTWIGIQWIVTLETALNAQWGLPPRGFLASRLLALVLFILVAALFLASTAATTLLTAATAWRIPWLEFRLGRIPFLWQFLGHLLPLLLSLLMFVLLYRLLPNKHVSGRAVWIGALVAASAWEAAKIGYAWYLAHFAHFGAVYGSLGALVGLVLWIYYSSVIALFGNEVVRATDTRRSGCALPPSGRHKKRESARPKRKPPKGR
jgi:membrane protein